MNTTAPQTSNQEQDKTMQDHVNHPEDRRDLIYGLTIPGLLSSSLYALSQDISQTAFLSILLGLLILTSSSGRRIHTINAIIGITLLHLPAPTTQASNLMLTCGYALNGFAFIAALRWYLSQKTATNESMILTEAQPFPPEERRSSTKRLTPFNVSKTPTPCEAEASIT